MPRSEKPIVVEHIYDKLVDSLTGKLRRRVVTNDDIVDAIRECKATHGIKLSENNPANFMKDIIRGRGASGMWPEKLKRDRIGGRQVTGSGNVFEFVPYADDQQDPFPTRFGYHPEVQVYRLQSVSIPLATKALGRDDETYLIQVAKDLGLVETHFALYSPVKVVELSHLQIGIKLRLCEVDTMYRAIHEDESGTHQEMIITAEAKKRNQRILEEQVVQQVKAAFGATKVNLVVPIAMAATDKGIYVAEFKAVTRDQCEAFDTLELVAEVLYELVPALQGINA